jgi:hypothetical protein
MAKLLSDAQIARLRGAQDSFESPIPAQVVSNGEFDPPPQSEQQRAVQAQLAELADRLGQRHGMDRRRFLKSSAGLAAAFLAMNRVYGPIFGVEEAEAAEPAAAASRAAGLRHQFVFDDQLHFIRDDFNWPMLADIMSYGQNWNPDWAKKGKNLTRFKFENFLREVFLDSDTRAGLISSAPFENAEMVILTNDGMANARRVINEVAGSRRALCHAMFVPGRKGWLEDVDRSIAELKPDSWKGYTIGDPFGMSGYPYRLDDEKQIYPFYEKAVKAGITTVCIHKGLVPTEMVEKAPQLAAFARADDVAKAAKDWPQISFVIYHSAYRTAIEPPDMLLAEFEKTGEIQWASQLARSVKENGLRNVYAELGTCFANSCITHPRLAAGLLGTLIRDMGAERVVWGTDSVWWGSPQWQIEALRRLEIPEDLQKKFGFAPLGPADGLVKSAILGLNSARLYKLEVGTLAGAFPADKLDAIKTAYEAAGGTRTNLAYGYVA